VKITAITIPYLWKIGAERCLAKSVNPNKGMISTILQLLGAEEVFMQFGEIMC
jgi:hypothetical protein